MNSRKAHNSRKGRSSKWIERSRRQAIYARDGRRCVYCQDDKDLSLDHLKTRAQGGTNASRNLVTACRQCNSVRSDRSVRSFCIAVASYTGQDWRVVLARVRAYSRRVQKPITLV